MKTAITVNLGGVTPKTVTTEAYVYGLLAFTDPGFPSGRKGNHGVYHIPTGLLVINREQLNGDARQLRRFAKDLGGKPYWNFTGDTPSTLYPAFIEDFKSWKQTLAI